MQSLRTRRTLNLNPETLPGQVISFYSLCEIYLVRLRCFNKTLKSWVLGFGCLPYSPNLISIQTSRLLHGVASRFSLPRLLPFQVTTHALSSVRVGVFGWCWCCGTSRDGWAGVFLQCELPTTVDSHVGPSLLLKHCFNDVISDNFVYFITTSLEVVEREGVLFTVLMT